jgi:hypothetical protein
MVILSFTTEFLLSYKRAETGYAPAHLMGLGMKVSTLLAGEGNSPRVMQIDAQLLQDPPNRATR